LSGDLPSRTPGRRRRFAAAFRSFGRLRVRAIDGASHLSLLYLLEAAASLTDYPWSAKV
jgi:hypothetical protein